MAYTTIVYKLNNKLNIGVLDNQNNIQHYHRLYLTNPKGFEDNIFYVMSVEDGDHLNMANIDQITCDINTSDEDDLIMLGNKALKIFKDRTVYH